MPVTVRLPTVLRPHAGGLAEAKANAGTLGEVLDDLIRQFPNLGPHLLTEGRIHRFVNVYVNDEDARYLDGLGTKVDDDAEVSVLPAVAGGSA